ncbi:hypothetical protein OG782_37550 (plasmid) [Streptomyces sp. NBC_00876]|uniref:beta-ketoacyl synthase N-terminal-like domain-containing protein n=1 Tax=Streptomyces sp. NBC_00876 TaxID=2975853 RepID=UPI002F917486|nr:hypothetical protein OG782_37550 [Streptomyces sp. NBC_00876]
MDNREILTRFKSGALGRQQVLALLSGTAPAGPATQNGAAQLPAARPVTLPEVRLASPAQLDRGVRENPREAVRRAAAPYDEGFAVIAVECLFPGAAGLAAFWETGLGPAERSMTGDGAAGFLFDAADAFDPGPFRLGPAEAASTDPRERLLLHCAWQALEDAGYAGARLDALTGADGERRGVGVFTAVAPQDRARPAVEESGAVAPRLPAAARLSRILDLHGPSQNVDTGPSSFLTAVHQALGALRAGECAAALVAAAELDADGGGVAVVLIKPLAAARYAGDRMHAVLTASAVGHPGRGESGALRERLRRRVLDDAGGVPADRVRLEEDTGSAAAQVGRAAGVAIGAAALVRAVLQLRHAVLLPGPGRERPAPWGTGPGAAPRTALAGVHEADAPHAVVVVQEPPVVSDAPPQDPGQDEGPQLVLLSAATPGQLAGTAGRFADWLASFEHNAGQKPPGPAEVARELRLGRAVMDCRLAVVVHDTAQLIDALAGFAERGTGSGGEETSAGPASVRVVDLRAATAGPLLLSELAETRGYVGALWRGRRFEQLTRLWLAGVDVLAQDRIEHPAPVVELPTNSPPPGRWLGEDAGPGRPGRPGSTR